MPATPTLRDAKCVSIYIEARLHKASHKHARELGFASWSDYVSRLLIADQQTTGTKVQNTGRKFRPRSAKKTAKPEIEAAPVPPGA